MRHAEKCQTRSQAERLCHPGDSKSLRGARPTGVAGKRGGGGPPSTSQAPSRHSANLSPRFFRAPQTASQERPGCPVRPGRGGDDRSIPRMRPGPARVRAHHRGAMVQFKGVSRYIGASS